MASPDVKKLVNERMKLVAEFHGPDKLMARVKSAETAARKIMEALKK